MRASEWYKIAGTDYIETAFRAAREAGGPEAKLYINDYGTDNPVKRDLLFQLVKDLLEQGVPIDGVGHQTHIDIYGPSVDSIIASMRKFAELGLDNLVTELDMSIYAWNDRSDNGQDLPQEILNLQAERYGELFKAFRQNKDILIGVVFGASPTIIPGFMVFRSHAPMRLCCSINNISPNRRSGPLLRRRRPSYKQTLPQSRASIMDKQFYSSMPLTEKT